MGEYVEEGRERLLLDHRAGSGMRTSAGSTWNASGCDPVCTRRPPATTIPPSATARSSARCRDSKLGRSMSGPTRVSSARGLPMGSRTKASATRSTTRSTMDDEPARHGAPLPGRARGREHDRAQREVEARGRRHDGRVVATQLQQRATEACRDDGRDLATHAHRAGGRDERGGVDAQRLEGTPRVVADGDGAREWAHASMVMRMPRACAAAASETACWAW
jgi:hypothetical protein